jgi:hypothetical protein
MLATFLLFSVMQIPLSQRPLPSPTPEAPILLSDPIDQPIDRTPVTAYPVLYVDPPTEAPKARAVPEVDPKSAGTALAFLVTAVLLMRRRVPSVLSSR